MSDEHLVDILPRRSTTRAEARELGEESALPDPRRSYEAFSRASMSPVYTFHCVLERCDYRSFQYVHLDSDTNFSVEGDSQVVRLRFCGSKITEVTLRGRNLRRDYDLIHRHRIAWAWQIDPGRDFGKDNEPVVTSITIDEVKVRPDK